LFKRKEKIERWRLIAKENKIQIEREKEGQEERKARAKEGGVVELGMNK